MEDILRHLFEMQGIRFIGVAGVCTFLYYALYLYLDGRWGESKYLESTAVAFVPYIGLGFPLQKFWTFRNGNVDGVFGEFMLYSLKHGLFLLLTLAAMYLLVEKLWMGPKLAQTVLFVPLAIASYAVQRWIFHL